jgi:hypothetical protein
MTAMVERTANGYFPGAEGASGYESTECEQELGSMGQSR